MISKIKIANKTSEVIFEIMIIIVSDSQIPTSISEIIIIIVSDSQAPTFITITFRKSSRIVDA